MRKRTALIMAAFIFALMGCASVEPDQEKTSVPTEMANSAENPQTPVTEQNKIFKAVLFGDSPFFYCSDGNAEAMVIQTRQG